MEIQTSGKPIDLLMEKVLCMNILSSEYFKELYRLKTYHEVIDEIYSCVEHVEPWMTGNCRGPSTAFCLLYKFFTMKLTVKQMHGLLKHPDSPYIRAIGFLYLRYVADPKTLWTWYEPYLRDDEEFSPGSNGRVTTMGVYVRDLILGQYYFDSFLPRIPLPVTRQVTANLEKMKLPTKLSGATGDSSRQGSEDTARRPPSVKASLSVSFGQRAPHRASTRDSSPVRRTISHNDTRRSYSPSRRSGSREGPDRDCSDQEFDRSSRDRDRSSRDQDHSSRDRDHDRDIRDYHRCERDSRDRDYYRSRHSEERRDSRRDHEKKVATVSSNLAKLKDLYGDVTEKKEDGSHKVFESTSMFVLRMYHAFGCHSSTRKNSIFVLIPCIKVCPTTVIASWQAFIPNA
ncbi:uncharacterized protein C2845_PM05G25380 [Panicum miliaceum]|uniref:Pre-mRNA-splicing factor 38 n=1 Tax=Panicum miliaceum TaxID=4540 RepID=A0A3L6SV51_PANMI|nr:uncharacterized protein C2845_PM05G25380 [Panicum miliaceum]